MKNKKPITEAQKIFGKDFGNTTIITERPANLRSDNPDEDKILFRKYKRMRYQQARVIKHVLR